MSKKYTTALYPKSSPGKATTCLKCKVPNGEYIVRRMDGTGQWAFDLDLHKEYPMDWTYPAPAIVKADGYCQSCRRKINREKA